MMGNESGATSVAHLPAQKVSSPAALRYARGTFLVVIVGAIIRMAVAFSLASDL